MIQSNSDNKTAILLLNIGSPKTPHVIHVASYLSKFLTNKRIIRLPYLLRFFIVNICIIPLRSFKASKRYRRLWDLYNGEFPLVKYARLVQKQLNDELAQYNTSVFAGMCYGYLNIKSQVSRIVEENYAHIILLPLFPQYADSSSNVALSAAKASLQKASFKGGISVVHPFYNHPSFLHTWAEKIKQCTPQQYDLILFSYHSIPLKEQEMTREYDYEGACKKTTELIVEKIAIPLKNVQTVFHSQMRSNWITPFLDETIMNNIETYKNILVVMPGFVADCLETVLEMNEYRQLFLQKGGEKLDLVENLNADKQWINALKDICLPYIST